MKKIKLIFTFFVNKKISLLYIYINLHRSENSFTFQ